jgi:hypothetical protein
MIAEMLRLPVDVLLRSLASMRPRLCLIAEMISTFELFTSMKNFNEATIK